MPVIDFNVRIEGDPMYAGSPVIISDLDGFKQEIIILFATLQNEIYGNNEIGLDIEEYLWKLNVSESQLQAVLRAAITKHCSYASIFSYSISVSFVEGTNRDIAIIDIAIDSDVEEKDSVLSNHLQFVFK